MDLMGNYFISLIQSETSWFAHIDSHRGVIETLWHNLIQKQTRLVNPLQQQS